MADTASQNAPPRKTLQEEIDYQTGTSGGRMTTFIIRDKTGDCAIPTFVNARLINCTIQSLTVAGASVIYFDGCTLSPNSGNFSVTNSAVLAVGKTKFNGPVTFSNSTLEVRECEIGETVTLTDNSSLKSTSNAWKSASTKSKIAVIVDKGSRLESYRDQWEKWDDYFWQVKGKSFVKIVNPAKLDHSNTTGSGKGFGTVDDSSVLVVTHPKAITIKDNTNKVFTGTKNSRVELYNFVSLESDSSLFDLTDSKAIVRNGTKLLSNKNKLGNLTNSTIDFSNIDTFSNENTEDLFTLVNSTVTFGNPVTIKSQGIVFNLDQSNINLVSNSFDYNSTSSTGTLLQSSKNIAVKAKNSKLFFKNIKTIQSSTNQAFDLLGSSLKVTSVTDIKGGNNGSVVTAENSYVTFSNVKTVSGTGDNGIFLKGSKASFMNVETINNGGSQGAGVRATDGSSVVCRSVGTISGTRDGVVLENNSSLIFKNKAATIKGNNSGVSVGTNCRVNISEIDTIKAVEAEGYGISNPGIKSRIEIKDAKNIIGGGSGSGINITGADLLLDNSGLDSSTISGKNGIKLVSSSPLGTYKAMIIGPVTVKATTALNATNFQITEQGVAWNGDTITTNCVVQGMLSNTTGTSSSNGGYTETIRSATKDISLDNKANYNFISSSASGKATVKSSLLKLSLSTVGGASALSSRSGLVAEVSTLANVSLSGSFLGAFASKVGSVSMSGLSSALGGASQASTLNLGSDPTISGAVSYFVTSGGDMGLQAENTIKVEALNLDVKLRGTNIQVSTGNAVITSSGEVDINGSTKILSTVGGSTITMLPGSVAIIGTAVTIN